MQIDGGRAPLVSGAAATYGQIAAGGNVHAAPAAATAPAEAPPQQTAPAAAAPARRRPATTAPAAAPRRCAPARCAPASTEETHDVEYLPPPLPGSDQSATRPGRSELEETRRALTLARQQLDQLTQALEAAEAAQASADDAEAIPAEASHQNSRLSSRSKEHAQAPTTNHLIQRVEAAEVEPVGAISAESDAADELESDELTEVFTDELPTVPTVSKLPATLRRKPSVSETPRSADRSAAAAIRPGYSPVPVKESTSLLKKAGKLFKRS